MSLFERSEVCRTISLGYLALSWRLPGASWRDVGDSGRAPGRAHLSTGPDPLDPKLSWAAKDSILRNPGRALVCPEGTPACLRLLH